MTEEENTGLTWESRLALWLPPPPLFGAFLIVASLSVAYLGFQWLFDFHVYRITILTTLMIAYILMVPRYFALNEARDRQLYGLDVPLSDRHETEVWVLRCPRNKIRRSRLAGAAGVLAFAGLYEVIVAVSGGGLVAPWIRLHSDSFGMVMLLLIGWLAGRVSYFSLTSANDLPLPQRSDIDLLNLDNLYAIGRCGLRGALVWLIGMSIGSLFVLNQPTLWGAYLPIFAVSLGIGLVVLLRPARKIRRLVRAVKREELARLEPLVRQARDDALAGDGSTQGRLTDLLTYKDRVDSTREWPFDPSTLLRFGLYLLIPVGSMVGGALVERVVDMVLD